MNKPRKPMMRLLTATALFALVGLVQTADVPVFNLAIKNHRFVPTQVKVPADTQFKVLVANQDPTPEEFESSEFNREKIVMPNSTTTVFVGPLDRGRYKFFDDFHQDTGNGVLIVQ
ncbi:MAG: cupredoxin domain-containing protein [Rhodanobacteraceae bacterium]